MDAGPPSCPLQSPASMPIPRTNFTSCPVLMGACCFHLSTPTGEFYCHVVSQNTERPASHKQLGVFLR